MISMSPFQMMINSQLKTDNSMEMKKLTTLPSRTKKKHSMRTLFLFQNFERFD